MGKTIFMGFPLSVHVVQCLFHKQPAGHPPNLQLNLAGYRHGAVHQNRFSPITPHPHKHARKHTFDLLTPITGGDDDDATAFDNHLTPIARGDDSDATAEAIATCAGIAPFNSLQG